MKKSATDAANKGEVREVAQTYHCNVLQFSLSRDVEEKKEKREFTRSKVEKARQMLLIRGRSVRSPKHTISIFFIERFKTVEDGFLKVFFSKLKGGEKLL